MDAPRSAPSANTGDNFETLLSCWLDSSFADDPALNFAISVSGEAHFGTMVWGCWLVHGDRTASRSGRGFLGPMTTIAVASKHQKVFAELGI
jgi:hypothetical protein